ASRIIALAVLEEFQLGAKLRFELDEHALGRLFFQARLVPVGDLGADENADHDDQELDSDRGPVLGAQIGAETAQDHWLPPGHHLARDLLERKGDYPAIAP